MSKHRIRTAPALALALALGLTAAGCAGTAEPEAPEPETSATPETESTASESPASTDDDSNAEATSGITVSATGDGPMGLTTTDTPAGDASTVEGRFIVGPGGCFSFTQQDQPQLLVFADGTEFVLQGDRPSAETDASGTLYAGERAELQAIELDKSEVDGIPQRCDNGSAETVLVVE